VINSLFLFLTGLSQYTKILENQKNPKIKNKEIKKIHNGKEEKINTKHKIKPTTILTNIPQIHLKIQLRLSIPLWKMLFTLPVP
jgi:hypothetical protein